MEAKLLLFLNIAGWLAGIVGTAITISRFYAIGSLKILASELYEGPNVRGAHDRALNLMKIARAAPVKVPIIVAVVGWMWVLAGWLM